jgi:hypothetical protein
MHCSRNIDYAQKPNSKVTLTFGTEAPISSGDMNVIQCLPTELVHSVCKFHFPSLHNFSDIPCINVIGVCKRLCSAR